MGIRHTVKRLEREAGELYQTLVLPDGTEVRYEPNEMLDTYGAYMSGEPHRLLPLYPAGGYPPGGSRHDKDA
jgi:hypothetical protein